MKLKLILLLLLISGSAYGSSLEPKRGIHFLYVDGVEVEEEREIRDIEPGKVQLVLKYNKALKDSGDERVFTSRPFVVSFEAPDAEVVISPPDKLFTYALAQRAFKRNPEWKIETVDGTNVAYTQEVLDPSEGFMPYGDMPERVAKHNEARGIVFGASAVAAVTAQAGQSVETEIKANTTESKPVAMAKTTSLEQLKAWYVKASKEERKAFRRWMIDQE